ncbi:methyl-accepting chemotaxis protein [Clostridium sp. AM27-31LB]|jgi:methyl-accepting chemotaxis protein|uniref:methyl-accepting chemotaxis protein n=1 Tax=Clostridia TaxID=186801 RepID=UPI000E4876C3|nr:methyl-accepting chemotaxis protein [Clostridium sp. AM27-31LB]RHT91692.1 methyl-accepting chemotaxis protein [Clostridium sp. AM27-31LB]
MRIFENWKLKYKILFVALLPILVVCIAVMVINNTVIKNTLLDKTKNELKATAEALSAAYNQNSGEYFQNDDGEIWKGTYNVSLSQKLVTEMSEKTGSSLTFFYGDKRLVTSLKDKKGDYILGSKAGDYLKKNVLEGGKDVFTSRVSVEGTMYYGYYIPVKQNNSDDIIGMIFAGMPAREVDKTINLVSGLLFLILGIVLVLTIFVSVLASKEIASAIEDSVLVVQNMASGNLNVSINRKNLGRKDEVGKLSAGTKSLRESLGNMIGAISDNTLSLDVASQDMSNIAGQASDAMDSISENLKSVLESAKNQAEVTASVDDNVNNINMMLKQTGDEADGLSDAADDMLGTGREVDNSLKNLYNSNEEVLDAIERIRKQTSETDISVDKIKEAVNLIASIAEETNLLSLNASIEAARAGESGKGFAVVAVEISKLAEQSNAASADIEKMIMDLGQNSERTVETMEMVQDAINRQSDDMNNTRKIFEKVKDRINLVAKGVANIREATERLEGETTYIAEDINGLNTAANKNMKNVKETMEAGEEVLKVVKNVSSMSVNVNTAANEMMQSVEKFRKK